MVRCKLVRPEMPVVEKSRGSPARAVQQKRSRVALDLQSIAAAGHERGAQHWHFGPKSHGAGATGMAVGMLVVDRRLCGATLPGNRRR